MQLQNFIFHVIRGSPCEAKGTKHSNMHPSSFRLQCSLYPCEQKCQWDMIPSFFYGNNGSQMPWMRLCPIQSHDLDYLSSVPRKSCAHLGFLYIACVAFPVHPTTVRFPQCNRTNSLDMVPGSIHSFFYQISWVPHWTETVVMFFLSWKLG